MQTTKYFIIAACFAIVACSKRDRVDTPDFDVHTSSTTYKVGDTVNFEFTGNPQNIVFWSGMPGNVYEYKDRLFTTGNKLLIKFNTYQQFGIRNNLSVLVSNDFNGLYDTNNVKKATWTDISSRVTLSSGADQTQSGTLDMSEFTAGNRSVTLAFRYITTSIMSQNRWVVRTFNADNQAADGSITSMATMSTAAWKAIDFKNAAAVWSITSAQLLLQGSANALDDDWVLTKSFNPTAVAPDKGTAIKNITVNLNRYAAAGVYTKPGTYKVVFEATNGSYENIERTVKEVTLTITP
jgi:plastocyanin